MAQRSFPQLVYVSAENMIMNLGDGTSVGFDPAEVTMASQICSPSNSYYQDVFAAFQWLTNTGHVLTDLSNPSLMAEFQAVTYTPVGG